MMSSGLNVPRPAIPMPDFEVPRAAPMADKCYESEFCFLKAPNSGDAERTAEDHLCVANNK